MKIFWKSFLVVGIMVVLLIVAGNAKAYTTALYWGNDGLTDNGLNPNYAIVTVNLDSSTQATITFQRENSYWFKTANGLADLNVNLSSGKALNTATLQGYSGATNPVSLSSYSTQNVDGTGTFNVVFDAGGSNLLDKMVVVLMLSSGTWSNDLDILNFNNKNFRLAAHISGTSDGTAYTGYAGGGNTEGTSNVPVPPSVWLLGSGLIGFWGIRRRFVKK